jgi:hypothetical protein
VRCEQALFLLPHMILNRKARYNVFFWFFLIGALAPIPLYFLSLRYPYASWRYFNIPIFFVGVVQSSPANGFRCAPWGVTGFIFNFYIRRRHFTWWCRYNYILSAALDAGVALGMIVIFFTLQLPKGGIKLNWWGNMVWKHTADDNGPPLWPLNGSEKFGPTRWS